MARHSRRRCCHLNWVSVAMHDVSEGSVYCNELARVSVLLQLNSINLACNSRAVFTSGKAPKGLLRNTTTGSTRDQSEQ